jgi:hypothetical protein
MADWCGASMARIASSSIESETAEVSNTSCSFCTPKLAEVCPTSCSLGIHELAAVGNLADLVKVAW